MVQGVESAKGRRHNQGTLGRFALMEHDTLTSCCMSLLGMHSEWMQPLQCLISEHFSWGRLFSLSNHVVCKIRCFNLENAFATNSDCSCSFERCNGRLTILMLMVSLAAYVDVTAICPTGDWTRCCWIRPSFSNHLYHWPVITIHLQYYALFVKARILQWPSICIKGFPHGLQLMTRVAIYRSLLRRVHVFVLTLNRSCKHFTRWYAFQ